MIKEILESKSIRESILQDAKADEKKIKLTEDAKSDLKSAIDDIKGRSFVKDYKATDEEALGLAVAHYCEWSSQILKVMYYALEDANFHSDNEVVLELIQKYDPEFKG